MNNRIAFLYEQAIEIENNGDYVAGEFNPVKFADLIVRECAKAADDWYQNHEQLHWDPATHVLGHFGVDE